MSVSVFGRAMEEEYTVRGRGLGAATSVAMVTE